MALEWAAQVIGINYYPDYINLKPLTAASEDAEKIAEQLEQYGYRTFRVQRLPKTSNQKGESEIDYQGAVKAKELREAIANLLNPPLPNPIPETALFFFSGHGWYHTINGKREVFLATSDAFPEEKIYGISLSWLGEQLQKSQVKRVIVWLDCCYSGELIKFVPTDKDYCLITATRSYETGVEILHEQGLLTKYLLEGLNPQNDPDGIVNSYKLAAFIQKQMAQTGQCPLIANSNRAIPLTTELPQKSFQDKCPYRSLSYFSENKEDAEVFYGRELLIKQLIQKVENKQRLIAVVGASGSGKSSLLRAGLLYHLRLGQEIPGSDRWIYITPFTPKETPIKSLLAAFSNSFPALFSQQKTTTNILHILIEEIKSLNTPTVLIIDQFEECFTMCDESKQEEFFDCLGELIDDVETICILIGMRSDFRGRLREYPQLAEKIHKPFIVEHLNPQEIEEAITKPANLVGLGIEGTLKQQLINDVEGYSGSLPLLQYTLTELWRESRKQGDEFLRLEIYQNLGGIEGTLQKRADEVYHSLLAAEKIVARRIFLELTQIGETTDTRRRVRLQEMVNSHHSLDLLQRVSEKLADKDARLITKTDDLDSQEIVLDVVHEALLRYWTLLNEWKRKYQNAIVSERKIEAAAREWQENDRESEYLLQATRLGLAEEYLIRYGSLGMLNGIAEEYIQESQKLRDRKLQEEESRRQQELETAQKIAQAEEKARQAAEQRAEEQAKTNKKLRRIRAILIIVSVSAIVAAGISIFSWHYAKRQATNAELGEKVTKIDYSLKTQPVERLVLAIQATGQSLSELNRVTSRVTTAVESSLLQVLQTDIRERNRLSSGWAAAISPDGATIVTGSSDRNLQLWDRKGQAIGKPFVGHTDSVQSVAFSPDGKSIVSGSRDSSVRLWNLQGKPIGEPFVGHTGFVYSVGFSPDGKSIVSGSGDNSVRLWNLQGKPMGKPFEGHKGFVYSVGFSPDGKSIVSGSGDNSVRLWDLQGKPIGKPFVGHRNFVQSIAFSPDGKSIVSGSGDNTLRLWNLQGQAIGKPFVGHTNYVLSVAFSPDGKSIVSGSNDNSVRLWDLQGKPIGKPLVGHTQRVYSVGFSPDGKSIVSGSDDNSVRLWDLQGQAIGKSFVARTNSVWSVAFSPDGKSIVSGSGDNSVRLWNLQGQAIGKPFVGHTNSVWSVAFSPDGKHIASGSNDNTLRLWNLQGQAIGKPFVGHTNYVNSVTFSPDGKSIASGSGDNTLRLWNLQGQAIGKPFVGHTNYVLSVAFSPDGKFIASGSDDNSVRLWDLQGRPIGKPFIGHTNSVWSVAFSPDGKFIVSGSDDNTLRLWNLQGQPIGKPLVGHTDSVFSVAFSPDGKSIVSGSRDNTLRLWDLQGQLMSILQGHENTIFSVAFSPNGRYIVSGSQDNTLRLWDRELKVEQLLKIACNQLREHPVLAKDKDASDTCLRWGGWNDR
ncbi:MAG: Tol-Pal system protein TolB [Chroococcidiopsis sp. SAG 2025]|uniref:nSTAND1 domain-containing NTPase n=1 Tax=Chroococcidiopsis sp. SAG 2025 TaxID=171389 RepID=UPI002936E4A1|nr:caspase family protein [Chroococcidiopsis sp. SAG 2025]MDV2993263.1 Tol-Pal system protein TolB [Chroococcidiopsis sp. SAG 2025]